LKAKPTKRNQNKSSGFSLGEEGKEEKQWLWWWFSVRIFFLKTV